MLTTLRISGFAIVDAIEVRFGPGLNVLTGETGAGKSILVNALHLVLGGRMSAEVLREGADEAVVEALFELPPAHPVFARLEAAGLCRPGPGRAPLAGRRVRAPRAARGVARRARPGVRERRALHASPCWRGRCAARWTSPASTSTSRSSTPARHLALLDACGRARRSAPQEPARRPLLRYRAAHAALAALVRERDRARRGRGRAGAAGGLPRLPARASSTAPIRGPGELEALEDERRVLASAEKLREAARAAEALAYGEEGSASERVAQAARALAEAALLDRAARADLALLRSAAVELEEAGRELGRYAESVGGDPERLAAVEDRLELLRGLARKHGGSLEAAVARRAEMHEELARLRGGGERLRELAGEIAARGSEALALARGARPRRAPRRRAGSPRRSGGSSRGSPWGAAGSRSPSCRRRRASRWTGAVLGAGRRRARGDPHRAEPRASRRGRSRGSPRAASSRASCSP